MSLFRIRNAELQLMVRDRFSAELMNQERRRVCGGSGRYGRFWKGVFLRLSRTIITLMKKFPLLFPPEVLGEVGTPHACLAAIALELSTMINALSFSPHGTRCMPDTGPVHYINETVRQVVQLGQDYVKAWVKAANAYGTQEHASHAFDDIYETSRYKWTTVWMTSGFVPEDEQYGVPGFPGVHGDYEAQAFDDSAAPYPSDHDEE